MRPIPVYILAGGRSRRFGSDKALALLDGKPLILHVAEALRPWASSVTVVADRAGKYDDLGLSTLGDLRRGLGPLGGLSTALTHCVEPWLLAAPCDFAGLRAHWVERLLESATGGACAVAFHSERWHPLPGVYHRSLVDTVAMRLRQADRSLKGLLNAVAAVAVPPPAGWPEAPGINTPQEFERQAQAVRNEAAGEGTGRGRSRRSP